MSVSKATCNIMGCIFVHLACIFVYLHKILLYTVHNLLTAISTWLGGGVDQKVAGSTPGCRSLTRNDSAQVVYVSLYVIIWYWPVGNVAIDDCHNCHGHGSHTRQCMVHLRSQSSFIGLSEKEPHCFHPACREWHIMPLGYLSKY